MNFDELTIVAAANFTSEFRLSTVDAFLYAPARATQSQLVTSNTRFRGPPQTIIL